LKEIHIKALRYKLWDFGIDPAALDEKDLTNPMVEGL